MTPEVWYQTDRSLFHLVSFSEWHYADEPFLSSRLLQLRPVPTSPHPTRSRSPPPISMEGYGWGSHLCVSFFVVASWLVTSFSIFSFTFPFLLFYPSTARVHHVPIRMVSSIWGRFLMPWPRVSSGAYGWVGTSKSRPLVLILRSWTRVEAPGSFAPFELSNSSW